MTGPLHIPCRRRVLLLALVLMAQAWGAGQSKVLVPMDLEQTDHLKAYGIAYWTLTKNIEVDWLLNYRGGSFMIDANPVVTTECRVRGVAFQELSTAQAAQLYAEVQQEDNNMDVVRLEKAPKSRRLCAPRVPAVGRCRDTRTGVCGDRVRQTLGQGGPGRQAERIRLAASAP